MKKALLLALLLFLLSGCAGLPGDINPAPTKDEQAGGGNRKFAASSTTPTPFKPQAPLVMETAVSLLGSGAEPLQPGQAVQTGALTFTLLKAQVSKQKTAIGYQVSGLPADYAPMPGLGNPWILLPNGQRLEVVEGGGGGGGGGAQDNGSLRRSEYANFDFPALPAGTKEFGLVIVNTWSGAVQTWSVPVRVSQ